MILAGYVLYKDFKIAATYRNAVFSIKSRGFGFETVKDLQAYSEPCQTTKMKIFETIIND